MTTNQLAYWKNQEEIRANKEAEAIKRRQNELTEFANAVKSAEQKETARANLEKERLNRKEESRKWSETLTNEVNEGTKRWNEGVNNALNFIKTLFQF